MSSFKLKYSEENPLRLDKYLRSLQKEELYSRSFIEKLIEDGQILVNSETVKKSHLLRKGDTIEVHIPPSETKELTPEPMELDICYEDADLAIVNKPAGLTVHPAPGNYSGTLVNALLYHFSQLSHGYESDRPGIVHRLDKDTSGLIIVAKNDKTQSLLSQMFQDRKIDKWYKTILVNSPPQDKGIIETNIARSKRDRTKMTVAKEGKKAVSEYNVLQHFHYFSYVEVKLLTGRTHQIRLHCVHLNCPVLGDETYASVKQIKNMIPVQMHRKLKALLKNHLQRQALHAYRLRFTHPHSGEIIDVSADLPQDMQYALGWLKENFT